MGSHGTGTLKLPSLGRKPTEVHSRPLSVRNTALSIRRLKYRLQPLKQHAVFGPRLDMSSQNLLRWLRVSGFDVFAADSKIQRWLRLREKLNIDMMVETDQIPKIFRSGYPGGLCGFDREGSAVFYELFGLLEVKDILRSACKDSYIKFKFYQHDKILRYLKELNQEIGRPVDTLLVVVDMQFCQQNNLSTPNVVVMNELFQLLIDNYPTLIKEVVCLNVPDNSDQLSQSLTRRDLVTLLGRNSIRELRKRIALTELPVYLGGRKPADGSRPFVTLNIDWSIKVPHLILSSKESEASEQHTIGPGVRRVEEYYVSAPGSVMAWVLRDVSSPVQLYVYHSTLAQRNIVSRPVGLPDVQSGIVDCSVTGRYLIVLDNTPNLDTRVSYRMSVTVTPPDTYMAQLAPMIPLVNTLVPRSRPSIETVRLKRIAEYSSPNVDWLKTI